jgi:uncharacterized BrkB/YihY/UPF0761 family membrane protein
LFSWYVGNFGHYDRTYAPLGAMIGFMTGIWLSLMDVLLGAELNCEIERFASTDEQDAIARRAPLHKIRRGQFARKEREDHSSVGTQ